MLQVIHKTRVKRRMTKVLQRHPTKEPERPELTVFVRPVLLRCYSFRDRGGRAVTRAAATSRR